MEELDKTNQLISDFIYKYPQIVTKILADNGIYLKKPLTLTVITKSVFTELYVRQNAKLANDLEKAIANKKYANFIDPISLSVTAGLSIVSSVLGGNQARKAREAAKQIALANLSQQRLLEEEKIRTGAETERTRILLQTLQQYQSDLQTQSTQRIKDVWIYTLAIGAGVGVIYGLSILLTEK